MRKYSKVQENYLLAKANLDVLEAQEKEIDRKYIVEHHIVNPDGSIPSVSWMIDDDEIANKAIAECSKIVEDSGLWAQILEARELLKEAEKVLIAYGLSIAPSKERLILEKTVVNNYTTRLKVIDLVLKLDVSTVTV